MSRASAAHELARSVGITALVTAAGLGLSACAPAEAAPRTVTVYAAASLTEAFADLERDFEAQHPGVDVVVVHGGSADLAAAIREGAPADVFAAANEQQMDAVAPERIKEPRIFATNTLTLIVEPGNPLGLSGMADLERRDVISVVCAAAVPCGEATARLAAVHDTTLSPSSEERSVTDVLGKVATGQADAGVVYATDVARSDGVEAVPLARASEAPSSYPIAPLRGGGAPALAIAFVDMATSPDGLATLASHGFGAP